MKYKSSRGEVSGLSFEQALLAGYAEDGGLLVPESVPQLSQATLKQWSLQGYPQLVKNVASLFISESEIPKADLDGN